MGGAVLAVENSPRLIGSKPQKYTLGDERVWGVEREGVLGLVKESMRGGIVWWEHEGVRVARVRERCVEQGACEVGVGLTVVKNVICGRCVF